MTLEQDYSILCHTAKLSREMRNVMASLLQLYAPLNFLNRKERNDRIVETV